MYICNGIVHAGLCTCRAYQTCRPYKGASITVQAKHIEDHVTIWSRRKWEKERGSCLHVTTCEHLPKHEHFSQSQLKKTHRTSTGKDWLKKLFLNTYKSWQTNLSRSYLLRKWWFCLLAVMPNQGNVSSPPRKKKKKLVMMVMMKSLFLLQPAGFVMKSVYPVFNSIVLSRCFSDFIAMFLFLTSAPESGFADIRRSL